MTRDETVSSAPVDPLTGFDGRLAFLEKAASLRAAGDGLSLLLVDVERFQRVNDALGPRLGDRLLAKVAERLRHAVPDARLFGRMSGDEFAVLLDPAARAAEVAARVFDFCKRPFLIDGQVVELAAYVGLAEPDPHLEDLLALLHAAGIALHACKQAEPGVMRFDPRQRQQAIRSYQIERELRLAVMLEHGALSSSDPSDAFDLHFQPKVETASGRPAGFEALLRWRLSDGRPVSPAEFVPIAERTGLIDPLGLWALRRGVRALAQLPAPISVAVNVAPSQLRNVDWLIANLKETLETHPIAPERLQIEVTETAFNEDLAGALTRLRDLGLSLWIDDFGSGHSSLARLCSLPFTGLKIDRSVIPTLQDPSGPRLLGSIVSLAEALDAVTVLEGVEEPAHVAAAEAAGIDYLQGFYFSKPAPLAEAQVWLARQPGDAALQETDNAA